MPDTLCGGHCRRCGWAADALRDCRLRRTLGEDGQWRLIQWDGVCAECYSIAQRRLAEAALEAPGQLKFGLDNEPRLC